MASPQPVRVVNLADEAGGRRFKGKYDGDMYILEPGQEAHVPWAAACLWLGNPHTVDDGNNKHRRDALNALAVKYGVYENEELWASNRPTLRVFSLEGDPITMLLDDPDGDEILPDIQTKRENQLLESRLESMERELAILRRRQKRGPKQTGPEPSADEPVGNRTEPQIGTLGEGEDGDVEEDTPDRVAVK